MQRLNQYLERLFQKNKQRIPQQGAQLAATRGAVVILTHDQQSVIVTPQLARDLAHVLPRLAAQAEGRHYEQQA